MFIFEILVLAFASSVNAQLDVIVDCTTAPKLQDWCTNTLQPTGQNYYQMAANYIDPTSTYAAQNITVTMDGTCSGYIEHGGNSYAACAGDLSKQSNGVTKDQMDRIIEMFSYSAIDLQSSAKWFQDCAVAYIRYYKYENSSEKPTKPVGDKSPKETSDNGCAYWLNYVIQTYPNSNQDVLQQIVSLSHQTANNQYCDSMWKTVTGKTGMELWKAMQASGSKENSL